MPSTKLTSFPVSNVSTNLSDLPTGTYKAGVESLIGTPIESCSRYHGKLVKDTFFGRSNFISYHPFMATVHLAFEHHYPLSLSPDMIWILIAQGVAHHINAHAEELRHKFVQHEGKATLQVRRDDFVKGSPENPWPEVFSEFSTQIRDHIGEKHDFFIADFSTTGAVEKAASEVVLMDAMQNYFEYGLMTMCGIPEISLEGTLEDWKRIVERVESLADLDLEWWTDSLIPFLKCFVDAAEGNVNQRFWQSIYKLSDASGGPYLTGWSTVLVPYLLDQENLPKQRNPLLSNWVPLETAVNQPNESDEEGECWWQESNSYFSGITTSSLPSGLAKAPFTWMYLDKQFQMEFIGGFVGVAQDEETKSLRPEIGWAVRELAKKI